MSWWIMIMVELSIAPSDDATQPVENIAAPAQTVSSIFAATPAGQAALTTLINGRGRVNVSPRANLYAINQTVTLTPLPDAGETFLNWSGDASGTQNPLTVSMTQSKVITANFTSRPFLRANGQAWRTSRRKASASP